MVISPEVFKDIHNALFNGNGNVIDVKLDEDFKHIYVYFDHKEDDGKYRDIIKEVLKKYGLEIGGIGMISNWENFRKAEKCSKLPPRYIPGFYFDVDALGTGAKIEAFYAGTKYWGD